MKETTTLTLDVTPEEQQALHDACPHLVSDPSVSTDPADWACTTYPWLKTEAAMSDLYLCSLHLGPQDMLLGSVEATALRDHLTALLAAAVQ